jgi:hypothetical protein
MLVLGGESGLERQSSSGSLPQAIVHRSQIPPIFLVTKGLMRDYPLWSILLYHLAYDTDKLSNETPGLWELFFKRNELISSTKMLTIILNSNHNGLHNELMTGLWRDNH